jgi:oligopeptide/dipeptide ABC transporter ATP-binding protein
MNGRKPLVEVKHLCKSFHLSKDKVLKAVDDVSFDIYEGETLGLVGESGCGKSTTGRCILKLNALSSGEVLFMGKDIYNAVKEKGLTKTERTKRKLAFCKEAQMIFQNPYSSLNPRMTVKDIIGEGIRLHHQNFSEGEIESQIEKLLLDVGLHKDHMSRFPHEFSGGQRQRIGIARALSVGPKFIVCDEPISALDVSVQAQVINMLKRLQRERSLTYLFIAHDLSVVKYISDRVIVMYLGKIMEQADSEALYENPLHPYTQALLSSIPVANPDVAKSSERILMKGEITSPINPKDVCRFADRCSHVMPRCHESQPTLKDFGNGHWVACHLYP